MGDQLMVIVYCLDKTAELVVRQITFHDEDRFSCSFNLTLHYNDTISPAALRVTSIILFLLRRRNIDWEKRPADLLSSHRTRHLELI